MSDSDKKQRERAHLNFFKEKYDDFPDGEIVETERPDFLIHATSGIIGIEHTEILKQDGEEGGSPLKAQESERQRILDEAKVQFEASGMPPTWVVVSWNELEKPNRKRKADLIRELTRVVSLHLPELGDSVRLSLGDPDSAVPREIVSVNITRFHSLKRSGWHSTEAGFSPELLPTILQEAIGKKNGKISTYQDRCTEVWLLLVVEGFHVSSLFDISETLKNHHFDTRFARLFLLNYFDGEVLKLETSG